MTGVKSYSSKCIASVLQLRRAGKSNSEVAEIFNRNGDPKRPGGPWTHLQIGYINNTYKLYEIYQEGAPGSDPNYWDLEEPSRQRKPRAQKPVNPISITKSPEVRYANPPPAKGGQPEKPENPTTNMNANLSNYHVQEPQDQWAASNNPTTSYQPQFDEENVTINPALQHNHEQSNDQNYQYYDPATLGLPQCDPALMHNPNNARLQPAIHDHQFGQQRWKLAHPQGTQHDLNQDLVDRTSGINFYSPAHRKDAQHGFNGQSEIFNFPLQNGIHYSDGQHNASTTDIPDGGTALADWDDVFHDFSGIQTAANANMSTFATAGLAGSSLFDDINPLSFNNASQTYNAVNSGAGGNIINSFGQHMPPFVNGNNHQSQQLNGSRPGMSYENLFINPQMQPWSYMSQNAQPNGFNDVQNNPQHDLFGNPSTGTPLKRTNVTPPISTSNTQTQPTDNLSMRNKNHSSPRNNDRTADAVGSSSSHLPGPVTIPEEAVVAQMEAQRRARNLKPKNYAPRTTGSNGQIMGGAKNVSIFRPGPIREHYQTDRPGSRSGSGFAALTPTLYQRKQQRSSGGSASSQFDHATSLWLEQNDVFTSPGKPNISIQNFTKKLQQAAQTASFAGKYSNKDDFNNHTPPQTIATQQADKNNNFGWLLEDSPIPFDFSVPQTDQTTLSNNDDLNNFDFGLPNDNLNQSQGGYETSGNIVIGENDSLLKQFNQFMDGQDQNFMDTSFGNLDQTSFEMSDFVLPESVVDGVATTGKKDVIMASTSHVETTATTTYQNVIREEPCKPHDGGGLPTEDMTSKEKTTVRKDRIK